MNTYPRLGAWEECIPKVGVGNTFESMNHFYCKNGGCMPLRTKEEYLRARQVAHRYPNHRILRYEGTGYEPCLYDVCMEVIPTARYVQFGDIPFPEVAQEKRYTFSEIFVRCQQATLLDTDTRQMVECWLLTLPPEEIEHLWQTLEQVSGEEKLAEYFFLWERGTPVSQVRQWIEQHGLLVQ